MLKSMDKDQFTDPAFQHAKLESPCQVQLLKFVHHKFAENCKPILFNASYDRDENKATIKLHHNHGKIFIKSLRIKYEFSNERLLKDSIECIEESRVYTFSYRKIQRHCLYTGFKCEINYMIGNQRYLALYRFNIPFFAKKRAAKLMPLDSFFPDDFINIFHSELKPDPTLTEQESEKLTKVLEKNLTISERLTAALKIEDLTQQTELQKHTMTDVKFEPAKRGQISFQLKNESLGDISECSLCFIPMEKFDKEKPINKEEDCAFALIDKIDGNTCLFSRKKIQLGNPKNPFNENNLYAVRFVPNRITIRASLNALEMITSKKLTGYFESFDEAPYKTNKLKFAGDCFEANEFEWFNKNIASNQEQKEAIMNIVNCTAFPYPYCVFGPPGTGKTSCLVECILQIMKLKPHSKILVTAQSNSACNEVGERLLKYTSINNVFRLYSSRMQKINPGGINGNLLPSSNLRSRRESEFPSREELRHFQVIICTLTTSSQLDRASLHNHFDYIFIDECAATNEPEACIPIVGLGTDLEKITANFVLIGDPLQLRPVIKSTFAKDHLELSTSLMERVMTTKRYQKTPEYDPNFVTQLLSNYRSHSSILHFSNAEFYGSKLKAESDNEDTNLGLKWEKLPNKDFPIIFHCEKEASVIDLNSTSSHNEKEIETVKSYVEDLLENGIGDRKINETDIGVISPYKAQLEKLRKILPPKVEIGSSEYFQGREKLIIIISTVKSQTGVGFLRDPRRLNVCLTRAKALMIVIGNAETLQKDETWKKFIHYCRKNNACVGSKFFVWPLKSQKLQLVKSDDVTIAEICQRLKEMSILCKLS